MKDHYPDAVSTATAHDNIESWVADPWHEQLVPYGRRLLGDRVELEMPVRDRDLPELADLASGSAWSQDFTIAPQVRIDVNGEWWTVVRVSDTRAGAYDFYGTYVSIDGEIIEDSAGDELAEFDVEDELIEFAPLKLMDGGLWDTFFA